MITPSVLVSAAILVAIGLAWAASSLFGKPGTATGFSGQATLAMPFMAISAGVGLNAGMSLPGAVIAAVSVLLALLVPAFLPGLDPAGHVRGGEHAARAATVWASGTVTAICLGALALSWSASIIGFASDLNRTAVAVALGACALLAAVSPGSTTGWQRVVAFGSVGAAALMVGAAAVVGAPGTVLAPAVPTTSDGVLPGVIFAAALVLAGMGTPGVRAAAARDRRGLILTAIGMAGVTLAVLGALLALCGGSISRASYPMFVVLGFMPPAVAPMIVAAMTLFGIAGVRRVLVDLAAADTETQRLIFPGGRRKSARWGAGLIAAAAVVIVALAVLPVPQVLLAGVAVVFAGISLAAGRFRMPNVSWPRRSDIRAG